MLSGIVSWLQGSRDSDSEEPAGTGSGSAKDRSDGASGESAEPPPTRVNHTHEKSFMTTGANNKFISFGKRAAKVLSDTDASSEEVDIDRKLSNRLVAIPHPESSSPPATRGKNHRVQDPTIQTRRLGGQVTARKRNAPTIIRDPMEVEMERRSSKFVTGGYKPMNTLNAGPQSNSNTRASSLAENRNRSVYARKTRGVENTIAVNENDYVHLTKKQRTGPSPKEGQQDNPISLDDSQPFEGFSDGHHDEDMEDAAQTPPSVPSTRQAKNSHFTRLDDSTPDHLNATDRKSRSRQSPFKPAIDDILKKQQKQVNAKRGPGRPPKSQGEPALNGTTFTLVDSEDDRGNDEVEYVGKYPTGRRAGQNVPPQRRIPDDATRTRSRAVDPAARKSPLPPRKGRSPDPESPDPIQGPTSDHRPQKRREEAPMGETTGLRLPDSILGNKKSTRLTRPSRGPASSSDPGDANVTAFLIRDIAGFHVHRIQDYYRFYIDRDRAMFWVSIPNPSVSSESITTERDVNKIHKIFHGAQSSKLFFKLSKSHNIAGNDVIIEFESHKQAIDLIRILQTLDQAIIVASREDDYLDRVFEMKVRGDNLSLHKDPSHLIDEDKPQLKSDLESPYFDKRPPTGRPERLVDRLDHPTVIGPQDRRKALSELPVPGEDTGEPSCNEAVSPYFSDRPTRSQTLRGAKQIENSSYKSPSLPPQPGYSKRVGFGPKWVNDLVYPSEGKKRETVEYLDLFRLDEDEFLNDSLIGFFARYVQHELEVNNPPLLKKMHFFNTYFYDTLTKSSKVKKEVNHLAVARWTKNINIFARDFIVVPVNDNLHWYLAIICNLPKLLDKKKDDEDEEEAVTADDSVQVVEDPALSPKGGEEQDAEQGERTQMTQRSFQDLTLDDQVEVPSSNAEPKHSSQTERGPSPAKGKPGRKKKAPIRRSLPKYDTDIPIIITLDSLAQPRSAAVSALKQWVILEAEATRRIVIEKEDIRGMTAKGLPSQGNYSDCGLYMCVYLEQFLVDPYGFVRKILQREEGEIRWPKKIQSEALRSRLRELIMELHQRQEGGQPQREIPPLGKIMVDLRETSPEIIPSTPTRESQSRPNSSDLDNRNLDGRKFDAIREQIQRVSAVPKPHLNSEGHSATDEEARPPSSSSQKRALQESTVEVHHALSNTQSPIVIDNDSPQQTAKKLKRSPDLKNNPPFKLQRPKKITSATGPTDIPVPPLAAEPMHHADPQSLADQMKAANIQRARAKSKSPKEQNVRSQSACTDFLTDGVMSYAGENYDHGNWVSLRETGAKVGTAAVETASSESDSSDDGLGGEVPETQEQIEYRRLISAEARDIRSKAQAARVVSRSGSQEEMLV